MNNLKEVKGFYNNKFNKNRQNFSETFKNIDEIWAQITSKPQARISKSFSLKNFVRIKIEIKLIIIFKKDQIDKLEYD